MPDGQDEESNRVQVSVWVDEEQREQWDDYADELGFESRGAMIRNAVRYFYTAKEMQEQNQRILDKVEDVRGNTERIESKVDSVKIDQLEQGDIDTLASELGFTVMREFISILGDVESVAEIEPRGGEDRDE